MKPLTQTPEEMFARLDRQAASVRELRAKLLRAEHAVRQTRKDICDRMDKSKGEDLRGLHDPNWSGPPKEPTG